jgi:hypothetical protein
MEQLGLGDRTLKPGAFDARALADQVDAVIEFRDTIEASGTTVGDAGTVPDLVRLHVINRTRWLWLTEFPTLKALQTAERSKLNDAAEKMLADLSARDVMVPPGDGSEADQSPGPSFGTRGGTRTTDPRDRQFTPETQDGL